MVEVWDNWVDDAEVDNDAHNVPWVKDSTSISVGYATADLNMVSVLSDENRKPEMKKQKQKSQ